MRAACGWPTSASSARRLKSSAATRPSSIRPIASSKHRALSVEPMASEASLTGDPHAAPRVGIRRRFISAHVRLPNLRPWVAGRRCLVQCRGPCMRGRFSEAWVRLRVARGRGREDRPSLATACAGARRITVEQGRYAANMCAVPSAAMLAADLCTRSLPRSCDVVALRSSNHRPAVRILGGLRRQGARRLALPRRYPANVIACEVGIKSLIHMVGVRGFEPPTHCSQSSCATRLRHTPTERGF